MLSCQGKISSGTGDNNDVSAPDTVLAYKYKESGKAKSANGDKQGAIEDYTRAIMVNQTYDTAYHNRGVVRADIGYYKDAILDYTKAIEINPHFAAAYFSRANAKVDLRDYKGALSD